MNQYYSDIAENGSLIMSFNTKGAAAEPVTYTDGTFVAYKDNASESSCSFGLSVIKNFNGKIGAHLLTVNTSDVFYTPGSDYSIMLEGANVDGKLYDEFIGTFSIENRYMRGTNGVSVSSDDSVPVLAGTTNYILYVRLFDSVSGLPKTGLVFDSPGMNIGYVRADSSLVNVVEKPLISCTSAYDSGGFVEVSAAHSPGLYRFDVSNYALTAGAGQTVIYFICDGVSTKAVRITLATYAQPGDEMDLIDAPNATAVDLLASVIWTFTGGRTLTSFGTLVADICTAVWTSATRLLTQGQLTDAQANRLDANVSSRSSHSAAEAKADISGLATTTNLSVVLAAAVTILNLKQANVTYDITTDPAQGKLVYSHKTTGEVLLTQNIFQPDGSPFTDVTHLTGKLEGDTS